MQTTQNLKIALVQTQAGAHSAAANLERAISSIGEAAKNGAKLICLPELFLSPYFCQVPDDELFNSAELIPGPTTEAISRVAKKENVAVVVPLFERRAPGIYHNSAAVIDTDGSLAGVYRKMHIPDDPGYGEKYYFTPGDLGFQSIKTKVGNVGVLICWDQWFPEGARITALKGADVLIYPTAIGWHPHEKEKYGKNQFQAWQTVQRGHAVANGIYVAAINRVGFEKSPTGNSGIEFWGQSFLCGPQGQLLAEGSPSEEQILYGEVDRTKMETTRRNWPFFRDRRIDAYDGIEKRFLDT